MKRLKEINLEDGKPTVADALIILKSSINNTKSGNVGCLYIIHGYGSSGKGGAIRDKARQWLNAQARNGIVKCVTIVEIKHHIQKIGYFGINFRSSRFFILSISQKYVLICKPTVKKYVKSIILIV